MSTIRTITIGFLFCSNLCAFGQEEPIIKIKYGNVRGTAIPLQSGQVINSFLGIPFAKAPVGELRFEPPVEPDPWEETLDALEPGDACIQKQTYQSIQIWHEGWTRFSEDCLHVNIYSPQNATNLPVMVSIHGGGYQEGANFMDPGYFLAEKGVVVVVINYRLAVLGFAYTGDEVIPGNAGIKDAMQALVFVQENIAAFGGDPERVTIFGESAGGGMVGLLLMAPPAQGLYQAAILQSGNELSPWAYYPPETNPEDYLIRVSEKLGCPTNSSVDMVACLRTVDAQELMNTTYSCNPGHACDGFYPVVDGEVLPDKPLNLREAGQVNKVPEMIGCTSNEYNFMLPFLFPSVDLGADGLNRTDFDQFVRTVVTYESLGWPDPSRSEDVFKALQFYYAYWPYYYDPFSNRDKLGELLTDQGFGYSTDRQAKYHSNERLPVYYYVYDYTMSTSRLEEWMGAVHGSDLSSVYGWPFMEDNEVAFNHSQANPQFETEGHSVDDKLVSDFMITLWTNFAKFSNPTPDEVITPDNQTLTWPMFSQPEVQLYYLHVTETPQIQQDYRQKNYAFWREYLQYLMYGTQQ